MLIDTHAHIQLSQYDDDREKIIRQCHDEDVGMILVGCDYASSKSACDLASQYHSQGVWSAVGQHPTDTALPFDRKEFAELVKSSSRVVGIGECGLDYFHLPKDDTAPQLQEKQKGLFREHLSLAHESHLPLIIHCRDGSTSLATGAHDDMIQLLTDYLARGGKEPLLQKREHGVMHCFTGTLPYAQSYLDLGFLISFTGIITFVKQYDEVVAAAPLEKILIETDSPFLTPNPFRGKKNNPAYVKYVAERIAEIKGISVDEVAHVTTENAKRLFRLT